VPSAFFCERCGGEIFSGEVPLDGKWFHGNCAKDHALSIALRVSGRNPRVKIEADNAETWVDVYATVLLSRETLKTSKKRFAELLLPQAEALCRQIAPLVHEEVR
jgi:hypothetical protein